MEVLKIARTPQDDITASAGECEEVFVVEFDHPWIRRVGIANLAGRHLDVQRTKGRDWICQVSGVECRRGRL